MENAAVELDSQDPIHNYEDFDLDSFLQGFPDGFALDDDLDLCLPNPQSEDSNLSEESETPTSLSLFAEEIEKFLMDDSEAKVEDGDKRLDDFLSDVLVDGSGSDYGKSQVASPESGASVEEVKDDVVVVDEEERDEEDDQTSKKRRRQMRNRESAMQSRERKKTYVKDLEMKSKYLESECRRLDWALRCCMGENLALHQSMQKVGASAAKQESAVLFMESLLLGSLFWLVSIAHLFLVPSLQILNPKDGNRLGRGLALEVVLSKSEISNKPRPDFGLDLVNMRRRFRGLRARMKSLLFPLHVFSAGFFRLSVV